MIKLWMVFEALAPEKNALEGSMQDHVDKIETENGVEILEVEEDEISELEDPHPEMEKGFSQVVELVLEVEGFDKAVELVVNYGPTYVQVEGPDSYELGLKESQDALQQVANTMHQYAQMGAGGVLISRTSGE